MVGSSVYLGIVIGTLGYDVIDVSLLASVASLACDNSQLSRIL